MLQFLSAGFNLQEKKAQEMEATVRALRQEGSPSGFRSVNLDYELPGGVRENQDRSGRKTTFWRKNS